MHTARLAVMSPHSLMKSLVLTVRYKLMGSSPLIFVCGPHIWVFIILSPSIFKNLNTLVLIVYQSHYLVDLFFSLSVTHFILMTFVNFT